MRNGSKLTRRRQIKARGIVAVDRVIIHHRPLLDDLTAGIRGLLPGSVMSTAVEMQASRGLCSVQF
jgi:hypothetical protein